MTEPRPRFDGAAGAAPTPDEIAELLQVEYLLDQRWPETKIEPSTVRIEALLEMLGSPQRGYPSIHVAGTNGKTSVTRMIDALLTALPLLPGEVILVSNEIGLGVVPMGAVTRFYVDELGRLNQRLAALADNVHLLVAGIPMVVKGPALGTAT